MQITVTATKVSRINYFLNNHNVIGLRGIQTSILLF